MKNGERLTTAEMQAIIIALDQRKRLLEDLISGGGDYIGDHERQQLAAVETAAAKISKAYRDGRPYGIEEETEK